VNEAARLPYGEHLIDGDQLDPIIGKVTANSTFGVRSAVAWSRARCTGLACGASIRFNCHFFLSF
jgi:hypothetical protein